MVVIAGAVAVLALCLVGLWASQSSIHSTAGGDGGGSSSSINNYLETFPSFEETKARGGSSSNTPKKKAREVIHNGQTKEEEKTDKKERLNEIVSNIRENRKKLGVIFSGDERAKKNKLMELYQTTPIGTETRAEKTASDEINNDPSMKKAPRVKTEEEGGHNDVETDDDASNSEAVTFQRRYKKLDRSKGERLSASVSLPLQEVNMKQWGYVPRPRVVSCEFERISDINKPTTDYGERNIMMNNSNDDNLYDTSMVITSVVRLPHHEPSPLLASKQYVTPYPDDDAYIDGIKDVIKNSKKYRHHAREPLTTGTCIAKHEWQKDAYPNCNILHEFELGALTSMYGRMMREGLNVREGDGDEQMRYWSHGFWRDVWLVSKAITTSTITTSPNKEEITVLKTLRYNHDFTDRNYDRHRKDALASMRLSNSPNVVDIYAYCSNSAIFEYGDGGDVDEKLFPWDSKAKKYYVAELSSLEKIDIGTFLRIRKSSFVTFAMLVTESVFLILCSISSRSCYC